MSIINHSIINQIGKKNENKKILSQRIKYLPELNNNTIILPK